MPQDSQSPRLRSTLVATPAPPKPGSRRRLTIDDGGFNPSGCLDLTGRSLDALDPPRTRQVTLAMKCLRPEMRSDAEQFLIGVEDLVHETAMLASLNHPHIITLHGRAGESNGAHDNALRLSDGYFILIDWLQGTLDDRIQRWRKPVNKGIPSLSQISAALSIADAMSYLHSKKIIFRDLKPANVGFDSFGRLKLFDFGFAIGLRNGGEDVLYDRCGTPRYMAPEVGLGLGYSLPADLYAFGMLLWEISALKKPLGNVRSVAEFEEKVFKKGVRPKVGKGWPTELAEIIKDCWATDPEARPAMAQVKTKMAALVRDMSRTKEERRDSLKNRNIFRKTPQNVQEVLF